MINELYTLSKTLAGVKIERKDWHKKFKQIPNVSAKSPCFRIWFSCRKPTICGIEEINAELAAQLRKWEPDYGMSFPAFNLPALYRFSAEQHDKIKNWLKKPPTDLSEVTKLCEAGIRNWQQTDKEGNQAKSKLEKCLHMRTAEFLQKIKAGNVKVNAVTKLCKALETMPLTEGKLNLLTALHSYILASLKNGENLKTILKFLGSAKPSVVFDLAEWREFKYPVAHEKNMEWINSILVKTDVGQAAKKTSAQKDAFGISYVETTETMPEVKLPKLGGVKLRSMFASHLCQYRYWLIERSSYPVSEEEICKPAKSAFEWLSSKERRGKTWEVSDSKELLFAYPSVLKAEVNLAALFGGNDDADLNVSDRTIPRFENRAKEVIKALKDLESGGDPVDVQVFAIRKMDKARSKVVYYRSYAARHVIAAAEDWKKGCANIPEITFKHWAKTEKRPVNRTTLIPKPLELAGIINKVWRLDGANAGMVQKIKSYQGLELFFDKSIALEQYLLGVLLANTAGLLLFIGNRLHGDGLKMQGVLPAALYEHQYLCAVLGLLLYKSNYRKEEYMQAVPYLIGQFLKVSDELHALYCQVVRKGDVPPQLIGNSLMTAALETPVQALAQLAPRLKPYYAWAQQYSRKNDAAENDEKLKWTIRNSRKYLRVYEEIADKLTKVSEQSGRFNDAEKAQLFIGYLAALPKKTEDNNTNIKGELK
jgi:hypothetical protein